MFLKISIYLLFIGIMGVCVMLISFAICNAKSVIRDYEIERNYYEGCRSYYYTVDQHRTNDGYIDARYSPMDLLNAKEVYIRAQEQLRNTRGKLIPELTLSVIFAVGGLCGFFASLHYMLQQP